jgi:hypothetical protein
MVIELAWPLWVEKSPSILLPPDLVYTTPPNAQQFAIS